VSISEKRVHDCLDKEIFFVTLRTIILRAKTICPNTFETVFLCGEWRHILTLANFPWCLFVQESFQANYSAPLFATVGIETCIEWVSRNCTKNFAFRKQLRRSLPISLQQEKTFASLVTLSSIVVRKASIVCSAFSACVGETESYVWLFFISPTQ
jgi:hypothetical protein